MKITNTQITSICLIIFLAVVTIFVYLKSLNYFVIFLIFSACASAVTLCSIQNTGPGCSNNYYGIDCNTYCDPKNCNSAKKIKNSQIICIFLILFLGFILEYLFIKNNDIRQNNFVNYSIIFAILAITITAATLCGIENNGPGCNDGYYGDNCTTYCDAKYTCNGNGTCDPNTGACVCKNSNFADVYCKNCKADQYPFNDCSINCTSAVNCNNNGKCGPDGKSCICNNPRFDPKRNCKANSCLPGWEGDTCSNKICPKNKDGIECSGNGTCGKDGICVCKDDFAGPDCSQPAPPLSAGAIGAIVLSSVILLIFTLIFFYIRRRLKASSESIGK